MNSRTLLSIIVAVGIGALPAIQAVAKGGGGGAGGGDGGERINKNLPPAKQPDTHETIESLTTSSITVNEPGGLVTYKLTRETEYTFKGEPVSLSMLQTGMRVQIIPDSIDQNAAGEVEADDPPATPTPAPGK